MELNCETSEASCINDSNASPKTMNANGSCTCKSRFFFNSQLAACQVNSRPLITPSVSRIPYTEHLHLLSQLLHFQQLDTHLHTRLLHCYGSSGFQRSWSLPLLQLLHLESVLVWCQLKCSNISHTLNVFNVSWNSCICALYFSWNAVAVACQFKCS